MRLVLVLYLGHIPKPVPNITLIIMYVAFYNM